jgi:hypothetical protein
MMGSQMVLTNINATGTHSLRSASLESLILKSVAENVIKSADVNQAESSLKCNVEKQQSMEAS